MTVERLAEENGRLVERERLDIAPTKVLGLFVVGRLARRHSLAVQLVQTSDGGVTAQVAIPAALHNRAHAPQLAPAPIGTAEPVVPPHRGLPAELIIPPARHSDGFTWFVTDDPEAHGTPASHAMQTSQDPTPTSHGGLQRRVPGAQLVETAVSPGSGSTAAPSRHDAATTRDALDGYQSAIADATAAGPTRRPAVGPTAPPVVGGPPTQGGAGLSRRVPGANLAPSLRTEVGATRPGSTAGGVPIRDPDAELAAFDAFSAGLARADLTAHPTRLASPPIPSQTYRPPVPHPRARHADVHDVEPTNGGTHDQTRTRHQF
jgi:hypothetical protein